MAKMMKLFKGKESKAEEMKQAKALRSGKLTPAQYVKGEMMEYSKKPGSSLMKKAKAAKGKMKKGR